MAEQKSQLSESHNREFGVLQDFIKSPICQDAISVAAAVHPSSQQFHQIEIVDKTEAAAKTRKKKKSSTKRTKKLISRSRRKPLSPTTLINEISNHSYQTLGASNRKLRKKNKQSTAGTYICTKRSKRNCKASRALEYQKFHFGEYLEAAVATTNLMNNKSTAFALQNRTIPPYNMRLARIPKHFDKLMNDTENLNEKVSSVSKKNQVLALERERLLTTIQNTSAMLQSTVNNLGSTANESQTHVAITNSTPKCYQLEQIKSKIRENNSLPDDESDSLEKSTRYTIKEFDNLLHALNSKGHSNSVNRPGAKKSTSMRKPIKTPRSVGDANLSQYDVIVQWLNNKTQNSSVKSTSNTSSASSSSSSYSSSTNASTSLSSSSSTPQRGVPAISSSIYDSISSNSSSDRNTTAINNFLDTIKKSFASSKEKFGASLLTIENKKDSSPDPCLLTNKSNTHPQDENLSATVHREDREDDSSCNDQHASPIIEMKATTIDGMETEKADTAILLDGSIMSSHRQDPELDEPENDVRDIRNETIVLHVEESSTIPEKSICSETKGKMQGNDANVDVNPESVPANCDNVVLALTEKFTDAKSEIVSRVNENTAPVDSLPKIENDGIHQELDNNPLALEVQPTSNGTSHAEEIKNETIVPGLANETIVLGESTIDIFVGNNHDRNVESECASAAENKTTDQREQEDERESRVQAAAAAEVVAPTEDKKEFLQSWLDDLKTRTRQYRESQCGSTCDSTQFRQYETKINKNEHEEFITLCKAMIERMDSMISKTSQELPTRPINFSSNEMTKSPVSQKHESPSRQCPNNFCWRTRRLHRNSGRHCCNYSTRISSNLPKHDDDKVSTPSSGFSGEADKEQTGFHAFQKSLANLEEVNMRRTNNALTQTLIIKALRKLMTKQCTKLSRGGGGGRKQTGGALQAAALAAAAADADEDTDDECESFDESPKRKQRKSKRKRSKNLFPILNHIPTAASVQEKNERLNQVESNQKSLETTIKNNNENSSNVYDTINQVSKSIIYRELGTNFNALTYSRLRRSVEFPQVAQPGSRIINKWDSVEGCQRMDRKKISRQLKRLQLEDQKQISIYWLYIFVLLSLSHFGIFRLLKYLKNFFEY